MNCRDIESMLADYLGDELDASDCARFEAHLASCAHCSAEVKGLQRTQAALHDLPGVSAADAARRTSALEIRRRAGWTERILLASLRYAAILIIGAGVGWQLKPVPAEGNGREPQQIPVQLASRADVHPAWLEAAARANRKYSSQSSFIRSLAAVSAARRIANDG